MGETVGKLPDGFPAGMRVLAVDDSYVALRSLELLLIKCGYKVTVAHHAHEALKFLRANQDDYDLVISDVNMPDMDGFKLLEIVGLEMDLPVIMLSVDADVKRVMKGLKHGAVDYLVKPVRIEELKLIWTHVARRSLREKKDPNDTSKKLVYAAQSEDVSSPRLAKKCKDGQKERVDENSSNSDEDMDAPKKCRITWTSELHAKFINAVNQLGIERAYPKKILDFMNVPDLTRENVASHLQKYRKGLKKNAMEFSQQLLHTAGISAYSGSTLSMTKNKLQTAFSSLDRFSANVNKNMYAFSSYLPARQSCNGNAHVPSTRLPQPLSHQNNFCRQYMAYSQASQLGTPRPGLIENSYMVNSTQDLGYQSFAPSSNQVECYAYNSQISWTSDGDSGSNLVYPLKRAPDYIADMFLSDNQIENLVPNEVDVLLACEYLDTIS